jgi:hypothetical protein
VQLDGDPEGRIVAPDFVYDLTAIFAEKCGQGAPDGQNIQKSANSKFLSKL